jgi:hypothetical protein
MFNRNGTDPPGLIVIALCLSLILLLWQLGASSTEVKAAVSVANAGNDQVVFKRSIFPDKAVLDGSILSDSQKTTFILEWYGPFDSTTGTPPSMQIPHGTFNASHQVVSYQEKFGIKTAEITIAPTFSKEERPRTKGVRLILTNNSEMVRYEM